ncbi:MAG: hypothetical protein ABH842_05830 [Candidatus Micrarchaeota archaeon]
MYKIIILAILSLALFGCLQTEPLFDEQTTIAQDEMNAWWFDTVKGDLINIDVNVTDGGPVDVYLVDSNGYADYNYNLGGGVQDFIVEDQGIGVSEYSQTIEIIEPGRYYLVVDNTASTQGTDPYGSVTIKIKIIKN